MSGQNQPQTSVRHVFLHLPSRVAARLTGVGDFEGAHAGKPDCYGLSTGKNVRSHAEQL
jgi:hypothetical protein